MNWTFTKASATFSFIFFNLLNQVENPLTSRTHLQEGPGQKSAIYLLHYLYVHINNVRTKLVHACKAGFFFP